MTLSEKQGGAVSQLIVYQGACGIVMATDSRAVHFTESGDPSYFVISKLYPLGNAILLATVGAGYGHELCVSFQSQIQQMRLRTEEDIVELAYPFLRNALKTRLTGTAEHEHDPELQRVYFVLAGTLRAAANDPMGFVVYASEHSADPLHQLSTGHFVCIPRQISLERRLSQLPAHEVSCAQVEEVCYNFLVRMASSSEDVGPPFLLTRIDASGIHVTTAEGATAAGR